MYSRKEVRFSDAQDGNPTASFSDIQRSAQQISNAMKHYRRPLSGVSSWSAPPYTSRSNSKIAKTSPPPPPPPPIRKRSSTPSPLKKRSPTPPPMRKRSPTPTPIRKRSPTPPPMRKRSPTPPPMRKRSPTPPPMHTKRSTATPQIKRSAPTPPPPPPPPPPRVGMKQPTARPPVISKAVSENSDHYFSPSSKKNENDDGIDNANGNRNLENNEVFVTAPALTILSPMSGITNVTDFNSPSTSTLRKRSVIPLDTTLNSIDMLNFEYIENCTCSHTLKRIIRLLSESKNKSPQLVKTAIKRLTIAQQQETTSAMTKNVPIVSSSSSMINKIVSDDEKRETSYSNKDGLAANLSRITTANTTLDSIDPCKSSLNFSLSPSSTLHGMDFIENSTPDLKMFDSGRESIDRRLGPIVESPMRLPLQPPCLTLHSDQRDKDIQISASPKFTPCTTQQIKNLRKSLDETNSDKKMLLAEIRKVTKENEDKTRTLDITRAALCKKNDETRAIEERLESKITELSQVLADTTARSKLVIEGERTYRKQCEEELSKENKKNAELIQKLEDTRVNLEILQKRHSSFRVELLKVTGISKTERRGLSQREFLTSLAKKIETMKNDNDRMALTLKQANKAIEERDMMEIEMNDALQEKQKLAIENQKLTQKIHELRAEVKSSRAYIDKLLRTSHESKEEDWERHELQYKQVIHNLRKQLLKQDTVVSIDLYKAEKDKVREKVNQLQTAEGRINSLHIKLAELQKEKELFSNSKRSPKGVHEFFVDDQNAQTPKNNRRGSLTPKGNTGMEKSKDDLTGITITFRSPESNNASRQKSTSPRTGEMYQRELGVKQTRVVETMKEKKPRVLREVRLNSNQNKQTSRDSTQRNGLTKKSTQVKDFGEYFDENCRNENNFASKNFSRASPLQLVRDLGGRSALKDKIKKMRSPKASKSPFASNQVQVIHH